MHILQHRRNALQAHARVDGRRRQRVQLTLCVAVVLHEHQVPDLDIPIEIVVFAPGRTTGHVGPVVIKEFGARAAGTGIAHLPKIILVKPREPRRVDTDLIHPDAGGLIVADMYGHPQPLRRQL